MTGGVLSKILRRLFETLLDPFGPLIDTGEGFAAGLGRLLDVLDALVLPHVLLGQVPHLGGQEKPPVGCGENGDQQGQPGDEFAQGQADAALASDFFEAHWLSAVPASMSVCWKLCGGSGQSLRAVGGAKADGGIDIVVRSGSSSAAVQCKHWAKWKCGPAVVRELLGAMTHEGFQRGFLVCRTATDAARSLADNEQITIVDRNGLLDRIRTALESESGDVRSLLFDPPKLCPKCGASMVRRVASKGRGEGAEFWGCSSYPKCNQTMRT